MPTPILSAHQSFYCPACKLTKQTAGQFRRNLMHDCPRLHGITTPMVQAGVRAKVEAVVREDYVGSEIVRRDDRRKPIMSVVTTRDDGQDCTVFAPMAQGRADSPQFGTSRQRPFRLADWLRRRAYARAPLIR